MAKKMSGNTTFVALNTIFFAVLSRRYIISIILLLAATWVAWKLYNNKQHLNEATKLSTMSRAFVPVEVTNPRLDTLSATLETDGIFLPSKEMFVISETQGRVLEVFKNKGEWLQEGDVIARVDDELLQIELAATQANLAKLRKDQERIGNLVEGEAVAKTKAEDIQLGILAAEAKEKALRKQIANTKIKAPMTGTLGLRFIERGSVIGPGIQVAQMTNLDKLYLMVKATERDVLKLRKGQQVRVRPDVLPDVTCTGRVTNIGLRADNTFNYDVEIEVPNVKNNLLRGGMHAKATFVFEQRRQGLTLPRRAVVGSLQAPAVYVVAGDTLAQLRQVTLGENIGDRVEVRSGLSAADRVVLSGQINLRDQSPVRVVRGL